MRNITRILVVVGLLASSTSWAQDDAPPSTPGYESRVWAQLAPVASGFTAAQAAQSARASAPSVLLAEAELQSTLAKTSQTLSRYVPNFIIKGSAMRKNAADFDFGGGGASVGALNEGPLTVGMCPGGVATNCVLDSQGQPVGAVAAQAFATPRNTYSVDATLSVPFSDYVLALSPARHGSRANERAARLRKEAEVQTVSTNAQIAYYDWIRAKAQLAVSEASLASSKARVEDARIGLEAGTVTSADALGLTSLAESATLAVFQSQSFLRLAESNLRITAQYDGPLQIGEDLSIEPSDMLALGKLEELIAHGQAHRPEARALGKARKAMDHGVDGASANLYPRLDGILNVTHANPNQAFFPPTQEWNTSWTVGLTLSWRLDGYLNTKAQVRELRAQGNVLKAQITSLERGIELEVRSAWEEWQRAAASARIAATELAAAEAMHEQRILLFQGGEATSTAVVEAEIQRANATFRKIGASINKRIALVRMRRAAAVGVTK